MRSIRYCILAAATLISTGAAFAQNAGTGMPMPSSSPGMTTDTATGGSATMPGMGTGSTMQNNGANANGRAPAAAEVSSTGRNTTASGAMNSTSGAYGASGTLGSSDVGSARYDRYDRYAMGSQLNASDVHATPRPGAMDNQLYRGN